MKLIGLVVVKTTDYSNFSTSQQKYPEKLSGNVEFSGKSGSMKFELTEKDFQDIEQLLLIKTKILAQEA